MADERRDPGPDDDGARVFPLVIPSAAQFIALVPSLMLGAAIANQVASVTPQGDLGIAATFMSYVLTSVLPLWLIGRMNWTSIVVGIDGVVVRSLFVRQFVPHDRILSVDHVPPTATGGLTRGGCFRVRLTHVDGQVTELPTRKETGAMPGWDGAMPDAEGIPPRLVRARDPVGVLLAATIARRRDLWARRTHHAEEKALERGERSGRAWVEALRKLAGRESYRAHKVDHDRLRAVLDDPRARPSARAAAAVVLDACDDAQARRQLRIAAACLVDLKAKRALLRVAGAADDATLAEALEAIEDEPASAARANRHLR